MKKLILFAVILLFIPGCIGGAARLADAKNDLVEQIPNNEFSNFEYRRNGVYSSAVIMAKNGQKVNDQVVVGSILMNLKYGPETLLIKVEGYKVGVPND